MHFVIFWPFVKRLWVWERRYINWSRNKMIFNLQKRSMYKLFTQNITTTCLIRCWSSSCCMDSKRPTTVAPWYLTPRHYQQVLISCEVEPPQIGLLVLVHPKDPKSDRDPVNLNSRTTTWTLSYSLNHSWTHVCSVAGRMILLKEATAIEK